MPRPAEQAAAVVTGLREHLIVKARAHVARLTNARSDWYDFTDDLQRERNRMDALLDGADVLAYRHEIPAKWQPPRDGAMRYTLTGNRLVSQIPAHS
ncbi:hypothetical protein [Mycolicibacterium elephantis]